MFKPVLVLVPGVWHVPAHFSRMQKDLENAGYSCIGVDLPSNNVKEGCSDDDLPVMNDDINAVRSVVLNQLENGRSVVVVAHSYGTIVATAAVARLGQHERQADGLSTYVQHIVFLCGFLVPPNVTMLAQLGGKMPPQYLIEGNTTLPFGLPGATHVLYNDIDDPTEVEKAIHRLKPQSFAINTSLTPDQITSLRGIPMSYLMCNNDNAVDFETVQKPTVEGFRSAGIQTYAEVADSGHSPFLKFPERTAKFIRKACREDSNTGFAEYEFQS